MVMVSLVLLHPLKSVHSSPVAFETYQPVAVHSLRAESLKEGKY